jgi:hypothetical protein
VDGRLGLGATVGEAPTPTAIEGITMGEGGDMQEGRPREKRTQIQRFRVEHNQATKNHIITIDIYIHNRPTHATTTSQPTHFQYW